MFGENLELSDSDREDIALVRKVRKGERDAFTCLVDRHQGRIFNFTYQFFRNPDLAAELTQETFLRVFRFIRKFDTKRKFSTWIFSIAKNICIDEHRKLDRNRAVSLEDLPRQSSKHSDLLHHRDPSDISIRNEERLLLEEAVVLLPEKYRAAIILCYFQELTYQEVADALGLSLNLVKVRIFRAKKMLLEILRKEAGDE